jgi:Escherichia/Staphylococcus phage prohead protease
MTRKTILYDDNFVSLTSTTDQGIIEAYVSVFGNVDKAGDRVMRGAFTRSLQKWRESGRRIPVIWAHSWGDIDSHIGYVIDAMEDETGLRLAMKFDLTEPRAARIFQLIKERRISQYSFSYDILRERMAEDGATELLELDLLEAGPCLLGMNPETFTVSVKSDTATTASNSTVAWTSTASSDVTRPPESEIDRLYRTLDELLSSERPKDPAVAKQVDDLILSVREEMTQESLDRAEQAVWERSQVNVIDPMPVRVDARMRPDR